MRDRKAGVLEGNRKALVFAGLGLALLIGAAVYAARRTPEAAPAHGGAKAGAPRAGAAAKAPNTVTGRVTRSDGSPIEGARVAASPGAESAAPAREEGRPSSAPIAVAHTGPDGAFALTAAWPAEAELRVEKPGFATVTLAFDDAHPPGTIVLERAATLRGRLEPPGGTAWPANARATVTVVGSGVWPARSVAASAGGEFVIDDLPAGVYAVRGNAPGWASESREGVFVEEGAAVDVVLPLLPAATLGGTLRGDGGAALSGARVWVRSAGVSMFSWAAETDAAGRFHIGDLAPGAYQVFADAEAHVPSVGTRVTAPKADVRLTLARTGSARGRLESLGGAPLRARLEVFGTTAEGLPVHLVGPPPDARAARETSALVPRGHLGMTLGQVPPITAATQGREAPIGGDVFASQVDGTFTLTGLPPGTYRVLVLHPKLALTTSESFMVKPGAESDAGVTRVGNGGVLSVLLKDEGGRGTAGVPVALRVAGVPYLADAKTDAEGRARFEGVVGVLEVNADLPGAPSLTAAISVGEGETREHVFLTRGGAGEAHTPRVEVTGRVMNRATGDLVRGARVRIADASATSAKDGTFTLEDVPVGERILRVELGGFAAHTQAITLSESRWGDAVDLGDVEVEPGARIAGAVVDVLGHAVAGAEVSLEGHPEVRATTGKRGAFSLVGVPRGVHHVIASHPRGGEAREGPIRVVPGDEVEGERLLLPGRAD